MCSAVVTGGGAATATAVLLPAAAGGGGAGGASGGGASGGGASGGGASAGGASGGGASGGGASGGGAGAGGAGGAAASLEAAFGGGGGPPNMPASCERMSFRSGCELLMAGVASLVAAPSSPTIAPAPRTPLLSRVCTFLSFMPPPPAICARSAASMVAAGLERPRAASNQVQRQRGATDA